MTEMLVLVNTYTPSLPLPQYCRDRDNLLFIQGTRAIKTTQIRLALIILLLVLDAILIGQTHALLNTN